LGAKSQGTATVGVISDIHGSADALRRVWHALDARGLTEGLILNAGDNVGYGADPQECIDFLRARPHILTVQGNYDRHVARYPERTAEFARKWGRVRPDKLAAIARDSAAITPEGREWLLGLPRELTLEIAGVPLLMTHYAPGAKEGLGLWTPASRLADYARTTPAWIVVVGHTHSPFARMAGDTLFVNPGTVGRAWGGRPSYAILTVESGHPPAAELFTC